MNCEVHLRADTRYDCSNLNEERNVAMDGKLDSVDWKQSFPKSSNLYKSAVQSDKIPGEPMGVE